MELEAELMSSGPHVQKDPHPIYPNVNRSYVRGRLSLSIDGDKCAMVNVGGGIN